MSKHNLCYICNLSTVLDQYSATSRKVASSIPDGVIGIFHWHNEYQVRRADSLTTVMSRLKFLEHSGPVQAYNGIALPLRLL